MGPGRKGLWLWGSLSGKRVALNEMCNPLWVVGVACADGGT